jgi:Rrf2 family protein
MKLINRDTDYAIRALVHLQRTSRGSISAGRLVTELHMPRAFARRLLQVLSREGILRSRPGLGGGYAFNKNPEKINLRDLVEIFQPGFSETRCLFKKKICGNIASCLLRKKIRGIEKKVLDELAAVSIAEL